MQHIPQRHISAPREASQMMQQFGAPKPEEQTQWFMVEERCLGDDHVLPAESFPLDELLRRFPQLIPLCTIPDQTFTGCDWTLAGPSGIVSVRIYPDE